MFARSAVLLAIAATLPLAIAAGQEKQIKKSDLPAAVAKTAEMQSKGAKVLGYAKEVDKGQTSYELQLKVDGLTRDVEIDPAGTVLEVEQQVPFAKLPAAVQAGLKAGAGKGTITKVESITKGGNLVAYEAAVKTGKKRSEVQVGPDGKALAVAQ